MTEVMEDYHYCEDEPSALEKVPTEVLLRIFSFLDLRMRGRVTGVCRRWQDVIYSPLCEMDDVMVVNIFQRSVWDTFEPKNRILRMLPIDLEDTEGLERIFRIIRVASTVKFWYHDTSFANEAVDAVVAAGAKLRTVDLYPYGNELITDHLCNSIPGLTDMTMRPHGQKYFWNAMKLTSFPRFENLTSLSVDSISFDEDVSLPPNLRAFEFNNRSDTQYLNLLEQLKALKKLENFSIAHGNMEDVSDFISFLDALDATNIPTLITLTMKFCKLPKREKYYELIGEAEPIFKEKQIVNVRKMNLKMLKLDLCCGEIYSIGRSFIDFNSQLTTLALQIIEEEDSMKAVRRLAEVAENKRVWIHLGVMQRDMAPRVVPSGVDDEEIPLPPPLPLSLFKVLARFEASFMWKPELLSAIFSKPSAVQEIKLINCDSAVDAHLKAIAKNSPMLRRMIVIKCKQLSDDAMMPFIHHFDRRRSQKLKIVWKRGENTARPASFYLNLVHENRRNNSLLGDKTATFVSKLFSDDNNGERVVISDNKRNKKLVIQDFSDVDGCQLVGLVVGEKKEDVSEESEPPSTPAPPPPSEASPTQCRALLDKLTLQSSV